MELVHLGGDIITGIFPGCYQNVATKFKVSRSTVPKIWQRFCEELTEKPKDRAGGNSSNLSADDLELIEVLKRLKGSISLRETYDVLDAVGG